MTAGSGDVWLRRASAALVAGVAAYASYEHQRRFALAGGADPVGARLWPLSVDGLVLLATDGLLRANNQTSRRRRSALWAAFGFGIAVSLAANIAAAPSLQWHSILVTGWPPVALLLAVELLAHRPALPAAPTGTQPTQRTRRAARAETSQTSPPPVAAPAESTESAVAPEGSREESEPVITLARPTNDPRRNGKPNAEAIMWAHFERERAAGRTPTGAELDRVAKTNNYGRAVLARWRRAGRLTGAEADGPAARESTRGRPGNATKSR